MVRNGTWTPVSNRSPLALSRNLIARATCVSCGARRAATQTKSLNPVQPYPTADRNIGPPVSPLQTLPSLDPSDRFDHVTRP